MNYLEIVLNIDGDLVLHIILGISTKPTPVFPVKIHFLIKFSSTLKKIGEKKNKQKVRAETNRLEFSKGKLIRLRSPERKCK